MNKPRSYTIEDERIFNIRRSTAEAMEEMGLLELGQGDTLSTRHKLTPKGIAFFANRPPGSRFKWDPEAAARTTADYWEASMQPGSECYVPLGGYPDELLLVETEVAK